jgi:DNA-binding LacI/PurR family transcriptional regulator/DNA-binding transcriptional regulator YhcF (GntR family)
MSLQSQESNVYYTLEKDLMDSILSGGIDFERPLMSETALAQKYGISRKSVRKALQKLAGQGLIRKLQGKGTFVIPPGERFRQPAGEPLNILLSIPWYENGVQELDEPFIDGASEQCHRMGHKIIYSGIGVSPDEIIYKYEAGLLHGVIWHRPKESCMDIIDALAAKKIPQLLINREREGVCGMVPDSFRALDDCVRFLAGIGHRRIGFVSLASDQERREAFLSAMTGAGMKNPEMFHSAAEESEIPRAFDSLLARRPQVTAVILGGIIFTVPFLLWCAQKKLRLPEDISLINIDDSHKAKTFNVPVSVHSAPYNEAGRRAVLMLQDIIKGRILPGEKIKFQGELIIRKTCASPAEKFFGRA